MGQAASVGMAGLNAGTSLYVSSQTTAKNKADLKGQAATLKTQLLEQYRRDIATNLAQGAASGFTGEGNLGQINESNTLTLTSDLNEIKAQTDYQIQQNKYAGLAEMAGIITNAANGQVSQAVNQSQYQEIGAGVSPTTTATTSAGVGVSAGALGSIVGG